MRCLFHMISHLEISTPRDLLHTRPHSTKFPERRIFYQRELPTLPSMSSLNPWISHPRDLLPTRQTSQQQNLPFTRSPFREISHLRDLPPVRYLPSSSHPHLPTPTEPQHTTTILPASSMVNISLLSLSLQFPSAFLLPSLAHPLTPFP